MGLRRVHVPSMPSKYRSSTQRIPAKSLALRGSAQSSTVDFSDVCRNLLPGSRVAKQAMSHFASSREGTGSPTLLCQLDPHNSDTPQLLHTARLQLALLLEDTRHSHDALGNEPLHDNNSAPSQHYVYKDRKSRRLHSGCTSPLLATAVANRRRLIADKPQTSWHVLCHRHEALGTEQLSSHIESLLTTRCHSPEPFG